MALQNPNVINDVFGYPPSNILPITTDMIKKSMPVVEFIPKIPTFQSGQDLYKLTSAWGEYKKLVEAHDFQLATEEESVKMAFIADSFPTDTFANEYGENFLQKFTDVASEGLASIAQISGGTSLSQTYNNLVNAAKGSNSALGKGVGELGGAAGELASGVLNAASNLPGIGQTFGGAKNIVDVLGAGGRLDFPMVWKTSSFQPSYTFTVRLYNPFPRDPDYTKKFIAGPLTAILVLGLPRKAADAGVAAFTWPFFHQIRCKGIFDLEPAYISNITVVKGGDQQQISFQQHLSVVDIRIDIGSVYSSILADTSGLTSRPTIKKYVEVLTQGREVNTREQDNLIRYPPTKPGDIQDPTLFDRIKQNKYFKAVQGLAQRKLNALYEKEVEGRLSRGKNKLGKGITKNLPPDVVGLGEQTRVPDNLNSIYSNLKNNTTIEI